jgi:hypothetical protein
MASHTCNFACGKDTCSGVCLTCGVKAGAMFPNLYSNRVAEEP